MVTIFFYEIFGPVVFRRNMGKNESGLSPKGSHPSANSPMKMLFMDCPLYRHALFVYILRVNTSENKKSFGC